MAKTRSDSITHAVKAAQAAAVGPIKPPAHITLRDSAIPFWNAVVQARSADTWTDVDLAHAANLAHCQCDINRLQAELENEGDIVKNQRGTPIVNPKHSLLQVLSVRSASLSAKLHVHALATQGRSADAGKKLQAEQDARGVETDDELVPRRTLRAV